MNYRGVVSRTICHSRLCDTKPSVVCMCVCVRVWGSWTEQYVVTSRMILFYVIGLSTRLVSKRRRKGEISFVALWLWRSRCFHSLVSCVDWTVFPPEIPRKIEFNKGKWWIYCCSEFIFTSISSPILNRFISCRASLEWPMSSYSLVQSLPATSLINSPPPGCWKFVFCVRC